jgi:hypothetical protein
MLGHLNYLDLAPEKRSEAAEKARTQLRAALSNPALTEEQRTLLQERMVRLNQWVSGDLPSSATVRTPQSHTVGVDEAISVGVKV